MAKAAQKGTTKTTGRRKSQAKRPSGKQATPKLAPRRRKGATRAETVDITPSPRILKVLGDIEFEPWQCIAELTDNSFDEFLAIKREEKSWKGPLAVGVELPSRSASADEAQIVVADNGRGMTLERVTDSARAGWTANDPFSKLGLFGMGFNVATARLGKVTRIMTTRSGEAEWVGIEINLDAIGPDFRAPVIRRAKSSPSEHGTRIEVSQLDPRADWLRRSGNVRRLRQTLGGVYSYLLDQEKFRLTVNSVAVKPIRHCVWAEERSVMRRKEEIPAVIKIDKPLADRAVCHECSTWQDLDNDRCDSCGSERLEHRERRLWGWVGIQRYLSPKEYGVDFLRNGRKILRFDKTLFEWRDPDDPGGQGDIEYPIELPANQGRIVGEIHLDHVPVIYTKDNFDRGDKGWRDAVRAIRGNGPLLPEKAKQLGYDQNDSPLARLHRGYRRNDAGKRYLMPGNGKTFIDTREWGQKFHDGDAEYQDDSKWREGVERHEKILAAAKKAKDDKEREASESLDDPAEEFRDDAGKAEEWAAEGDGAGPDEPKTDRDRAELLRKGATAMPELDGEFSASGVAGRPVKLTAYEVTARQVKTPENKRTPIWLAPQRGGSFAAFVDARHPHFERFDDDPADLVVMELAQHLIARAQGAAPPISSVFADLKERYLEARTIDKATLVGQANQLIQDLKERMVDCVSDNPERPWENALNDAERHVTSDRIVANLKIADTNAAVEDGRYLRFVPESVVPRIVEEWPDAFFDGRLFSAPYKDVSSSSAKRQTVAAVAGYLDDATWLASNPQVITREQLIRARLSLQLLPDEMVEPVE